MSVAERIRQKLEAGLNPAKLNVIDQSAKHAGHAGARPEGETHFLVEIESAAFAGKGRLEMHRMVNAALAEELAGPVHALAITAAAPAEGR
ncbi:MAG: BolA family transcriptional regulator [Hyphomicrobiales bacterium]|nr:MAG: BolA family transcriptional regulator [Hyphomicrobiales bacterium]